MRECSNSTSTMHATEHATPAPTEPAFAATFSVAPALSNNALAA